MNFDSENFIRLFFTKNSFLINKRNKHNDLPHICEFDSNSLLRSSFVRVSRTKSNSFFSWNEPIFIGAITGKESY